MGFATLTGEQAHTVLRPIAHAPTDTTAEAIAPPLSALGDAFVLRLQRAEADANERLDEFLSEGERPTIARSTLACGIARSRTGRSWMR